MPKYVQCNLHGSRRRSNVFQHLFILSDFTLLLLIKLNEANEWNKRWPVNFTDEFFRGFPLARKVSIPRPQLSSILLLEKFQESCHRYHLHIQYKITINTVRCYSPKWKQSAALYQRHLQTTAANLQACYSERYVVLTTRHIICFLSLMAEPRVRSHFFPTAHVCTT